MEIYVTNIDELCDFTFYWRIENFRNRPPSDLSIRSEDLKLNSSEVLFVQIMAREKYLIANIFRKKPFDRYSMLCLVSLLTNSKWVRAAKDADRSIYNSKWSVFKTFKLVSLEDLEEGHFIYRESLTLQFRIICKSYECNSSQCLLVSRMIGKKTYCQGPLEYLSHLKLSDLLFDPLFYKFNQNGGGNRDSKEVKDADTKIGLQDPDTKVGLKDSDTKVDLKYHNELLKLFKEKEFNFVTLRTSKKDFSVHKAVLCARSPVFNAMFESQMKQNGCNSVDIDDIDSQTMAVLVDFLHFLPLDISDWDSAKTLYFAADKYQVNALKKECVYYLRERLSVENICDALVFADLHQDKDLVSCAEKYFCENSKFIFPTKAWKDMLGHTDLVAGILCKLGDKM